MYVSNVFSRGRLLILAAVVCALSAVQFLKVGAQGPDRPAADRAVKELFRIESKLSIGFYAISPDGKTLTYCDVVEAVPGRPSRCELVLIDLATSKELRRRPVDAVTAGVFSNDGKLLAVGSGKKGTAGTVWDVKRWEPKVQLKCPDERGGGWPLAFSPDGKLLAGWSRRKTSPWWRQGLVLWDAATGECRIVEAHGAKLVGQGDVIGCAIVGEDGKEAKAPLRGPFVSFPPMAISFPEHGGAGQLFVEYHGGRAFTTLWDTALGKPLRTEWGGAGWWDGGATVRLQDALLGKGAPAPGTRADLYRFRTTPGGRILLLPKYQRPPIIALPYEDGSIALAVLPDFGAALPYPGRSFTELCRLEDYKGTTRRTCRLTADGRRLVAVGVDPRTAEAKEPTHVIRVWDVSTLHPVAAKKLQKVTEAERERVWGPLFKDHPQPDDDVVIGPRFLLGFFAPRFLHDYHAHCAMFSLVQHPEDAAAWLSNQLGPPRDWTKAPRLIEDLGSVDFKTRDRATRELSQIGHAAQSFLARALAKKPPLETRTRIENLLDKLRETAGAYELRQVRIIDVLEHVNTAAARKLLQLFADGRYDSTFAEEAKRALRRAASAPAP
jgi:hypothetical protein